MECKLCGRRHQPMECTLHVRNRLYEGRVNIANTLMENQQLEEQVNAVMTDPHSSYNAEVTKSEAEAAKERTADIMAKADKLRAEIEASRKEIDAQKASIAERKEALEKAKADLARKKTKLLDEAERALNLAQRKWDRDADNMAATRGFLCMEAGKLYGLRKVKKGSNVHYEIGGVGIMDLPAMNSLEPEVISTCLAHITHILMLASHYLAIRLPAEITLPHRDYPRPTIFPVHSSYKSRGEVPFPGTSSLPTQSSSNSKDGDAHAAPRPRPLFVDRRLPVLAKEDPVAHKMFVEGVALLAYDVAWACCTQGVPIGDRVSADDVFHLGRNLYNLLIGGQLPHNLTGRLFPHRHHARNQPQDGLATVPEQPQQLAKGGSLMGRFAHGTAHDFLGDDTMRAHRLPNHKALTDKLRARLTEEGSAPGVADWEVLEDEAWAGADDGDGDALEAGVLGRDRPRLALYGVESVATVRTTAAGLEDTIADVSRERIGGGRTTRSTGTNGWTKLKPR